MPSMRLFRKRKSLAPGQGDATTRNIPEPTRLPAAAGPSKSEQQAALAYAPAGTSPGPDGVSKGDVRGESSHATSSDDVLFSPSATTEAEPTHRAEDGAATRQQIGRRNSKKDRFRLFRSRSSHFRKGTDEGGKGTGGSSAGGTKSRLSWPAPRSATGSTPVSEPARGRPQLETVDKSVSATAEASPPPPLAVGPSQDQRQPQQQQQQQQRQERPNSIFGAGASPSTVSVDTSSSPSWRLQSLKRLPSLSLKRRLSRSHKVKPPQVIVTPATVVSAINLYLYLYHF